MPKHLNKITLQSNGTTLLLNSKQTIDFLEAVDPAGESCIDFSVPCNLGDEEIRNHNNRFSSLVGAIDDKFGHEYEQDGNQEDDDLYEALRKALY